MDAHEPEAAGEDVLTSAELRKWCPEVAAEIDLILKLLRMMAQNELAKARGEPLPHSHAGGAH